MQHALACYKLAIEGGNGESDDEELHHLNIKDTKGEREVQSPDLLSPDVTQPLQI